MTRAFALLLFAALLVNVVGIAPASAAVDKCEDLFVLKARPHFSEKSVSGSWAERRQAAIDFLKGHPEVPSFYKDTENGKVPVFLVNDQTYQTVSPLIDTSVGYGLMPNIFFVDHAVMRIEHDLVDQGRLRLRAPGTEIHGTGIAWKDLKTAQLPWRGVIIQVSYLMPKVDREATRYYNLVRRGSLYRVLFREFPYEAHDHVTPNLFEGVTENCFEFCKGTFLPDTLHEMEKELSRLTGQSPDVLFHSPQVKAFDSAARRRLMAANPYNDREINWFTLQDLFQQSGVNQLLKPEMTVRDREAVANILASHDAISSYIPILRKYQVSPDYALGDMNREPVSFIAIFDHAGKSDEFRRGDYAVDAKWFPWLRDGQTPVHP